MKLMKRIVATVVAMLMVGGALPLKLLPYANNVYATVYDQTESTHMGNNVSYYLQDTYGDGIYDTLVFEGTGEMPHCLAYSASQMNGYDSNTAYVWDSSIKSNVSTVIVGEGITSVSISAFRNFTNLSNVYLPNTLQLIYPEAFVNCTSLTEITIPASLMAMSHDVFAESGLRTITFEGYESYIPLSAFVYCSNLEAVRVNCRLYNYLEMTADPYSSDNLVGSSFVQIFHDGTNDGCSECFAFNNSTDPYISSEESYTDPYIPPTDPSEPSSTYPTIPDPYNGLIGEIETGDLGPNVTYALDSVGTLLVLGHGPMYDYMDANGNYISGMYNPLGSAEITSIHIQEGITSIGGGVFAFKEGFTYITLPSTIERVGDYAFAYCRNLGGTVSLRNATEIGAYAFTQTAILHANLGDNLESIGEGAFQNCLSLTDITIPDSVTVINNDTFSYCQNMGEVTLPANLESIGDRAFAYCYDVHNLDIPETVTSIGDEAFNHCFLESIQLPSNLVSIGSQAFSDSRIAVVTIPASVETIGSRAFGDSNFINTIIFESDSVDITDDICDGSYYFNRVYMPCNSRDELVNLFRNMGVEINYTHVDDGNGICEYCGAFSRFYDGQLGDNVYYEINYASDTITIFGSGPMYDEVTDSTIRYANLSNVVIESGVTSIAPSLFYFCSNMTSIVIPETVTSIGDEAFYACSSLTEIDVSNVEVFGDRVFTSCDNLTSLDLSSAVLIGNSAFYSCLSLSDVVFGNDLINIGNYAFSSCAFESITIPDSVTVIGTGAFEYDYQLNSVDLSANINTINSDTFNGCTSLESIVIPENVTEIGYSAFYNCMNLSEVTFPTSNFSICENAFYNCNFSEITFPENTESIEAWAFDSNSNLTTITFLGKDANVFYASISNCDNLIRIYASCDIEGTLYSFVEYYSEYRAYVHEPDEDGICQICGENTIRAYDGQCGENLYYDFSDDSYFATNVVIFGDGPMYDYDNSSEETMSPFYGMSFDVITFESGITRIGNGAFENTSIFQEMHFPNSVRSIGTRAFYGSSFDRINLTHLDVIEEEAFANNTNMRYVNVNYAIALIADGAFRNCDSLNFVYINSIIDETGAGIFDDCDNISSIEIPCYYYEDNIDSLSEYESFIVKIHNSGYDFCGNCGERLCDLPVDGALENSHGDSSVYYYFLDDDGDGISETLVIYGYSSTPSYDYEEEGENYSPFANNDTIEHVIVRRGVDFINSGLFYNCTNLQSIVLGSAYGVDEYAFVGCDSLSQIIASCRFDSYYLLYLDSSIEVQMNHSYSYECSDYCYECGAWRDVDHSWINVEEVPATCTEPGHSAYSYCEYCGEISDYCEYSPAHDYVNGICTVCGSNMYEEDPETYIPCGDGVYYVLSAIDYGYGEPDLTIQIFGSGPMWDYGYDEETGTYTNPFTQYRGASLSIDGDITYIGDYAFAGTDFYVVEIHADDLAIGEGAFENANLSIVNLYAHITSLEDDFLAYRSRPISMLTYCSNRVNFPDVFGNIISVNYNHAASYECQTICDVCGQSIPFRSPDMHTDHDNDNYCDDCGEIINRAISGESRCGEDAWFSTDPYYEDGEYIGDIIVIHGSGPMYDYVYDESTDTYENPFQDYDIYLIRIEGNVTSVGDYAFAGTNARFINISTYNSVSIGDGAFENTDNLIAVDFFASITSIGSDFLTSSPRLETVFTLCSFSSSIDILSQFEDLFVVGHSFEFDCQNYCSECGTELRYSPHVDENGDEICDVCGDVYEEYRPFESFPCGDHAYYYVTRLYDEFDVYIGDAIIIDGYGPMYDYEYDEETGTYTTPFDDYDVVDIWFEGDIPYIGDYAFAGIDVASFRIPYCVETVGDYAFENSTISELSVMPSELVVGEGFFEPFTELDYLFVFCGFYSDYQDAIDELDAGYFVAIHDTEYDCQNTCPGCGSIGVASVAHTDNDSDGICDICGEDFDPNTNLPISIPCGESVRILISDEDHDGIRETAYILGDGAMYDDLDEVGAALWGYEDVDNIWIGLGVTSVSNSFSSYFPNVVSVMLATSVESYSSELFDGWESLEVITVDCRYLDQYASELPEYESIMVGEHEGELVYEIPATCESDGCTEGFRCIFCGEYFNGCDVIPATGHVYDDSCDSTCNNCDFVRVAPHNPVDVEAVDATCTSDGYTAGVICEDCDEILVAQEVIPATGHTVVVDPAIDATCTETGLTEGSHCSVCGEVIDVQEVVPATGHTVVVDEAVDATCTETGLTEGSHCSVCDEILEAQEVVPATGHTAVVDEAVEATCTETGLTEGSHCSVCDEILEAQEVVPATGHTAVVDEAVDATCTETGLTEGSHCSVCEEVLEAQEVIPATGHTAVVDEAVDATCTETGLTAGSHCSVCDEVIEAQEVVPATGHTVVVEEAVAATCTADGCTEGRYCSVCNEVLAVSEVVPATGHTEVIDVAVDATCTTDGHTEGSHCSACGEVFVEYSIIPATGHTEVVDEAVAATCTTVGFTAGSHCSVCGDVLVAQNEIPMVDHTYSDDKDTTCDVCGFVRVVRESEGWHRHDDGWHYIDANGDSVTGWNRIQNEWYYFNMSGVMATGWSKIGGQWYYFKSSGAMATGWQKISNTWYYFNSNGTMATGWTRVGNDWYYFDTAGAMATGWQQIDGTWYYFETSGLMATGLVTIGTSTYYFGSSGAMATGWQKINNVWYYFRSSGAMATGWEKIGSSWYYFNASGIMATGWQKISGDWYFFNTSGSMATGWAKIGNNWYYFNTSGVMATGWLKVDGKWYYFYPTGSNQGVMAVSTVIDGYTITASGAMA